MSATISPIETSLQAVDHMPQKAVPIAISEVVTGGRVQNSVFDSYGQIVLAPDSVITPRFKERLIESGCLRIHAAASDKQALTIPAPSMGNRSRRSKPSHGIEAEIAAAVERELERSRGSLAARQSEFKHHLKEHGPTAFDVELQRNFRAQLHECGCELDLLVRHVLKGQSIQTEELRRIVKRLLVMMTKDVDLALFVVCEEGDHGDLVEHSIDNTVVAAAIAIEMGLSQEQLIELCLAALVHDWGMWLVPERFRNARRILNSVEFAEIKKHPVYTYEILQRVSDLPEAVQSVCYQVHERPDGSGYPVGAQQEKILPYARILHVADAYTSLISHRPFRNPLMPNAAIDALVSLSTLGMVDTEVVQSLLKVVSLFPIGGYVEMTDGSIGQKIRRNTIRYTEPIVEIVQTAEGLELSNESERLVINPSESDVQVRGAVPSPYRDEVNVSTQILEMSNR